jgi:hypothetical protein
MMGSIHSMSAGRAQLPLSQFTLLSLAILAPGLWLEERPRTGVDCLRVTRMPNALG